MCIPRLVIGTIPLLISAVGVASGQDYPNRPIHIVATAPGGPNDFAARIIAAAITGPLGQPVIVDNQGSALRSAEFVSKAPPDGYTLLIGSDSFYTLFFLQKVPYDP